MRGDVFFASYSGQGSLRYSLRLGSSSRDGAHGVTALPAGGWLVPFYTQQPITLGDQQIPGGEHLLFIDEH